MERLRTALRLGVALTLLSGCPPRLRTPEELQSGEDDAPCDGGECQADGGEGSTCLSSPDDISAISAGASHTCAIADGDLYCWGAPLTSNVSTTSRPSMYGPDGGWIDVSVGNAYACGVRAIEGGNALYCWGLNSYGRLGFGDPGVAYEMDREQTTRTDWERVSAGDRATCAITNESGENLYCWGSGDYLGLGAANGDTAIPTKVPTGVHVIDVEVGPEHACAVEDGTVVCWGNNEEGRTGFTGQTSGITFDPMRFGAGGNSYWQISAGESHTCVVTSPNGNLYCWGNNLDGQLGRDTSGASSPVPATTEGGNGYTRVGAGSQHTCAVTDPDVGSPGLYCWGDGSDGALGFGDTDDREVPFLVDEGGWTLISAGERHSCGVRDDRLYCWGTDTDGSLGIEAEDGQVETEPREVCFE